MEDIPSNDDHMQQVCSDRLSSMQAFRFNPFESSPPNTPPSTRLNISKNSTSKPFDLNQFPESPPQSPAPRDPLGQSHQQAQWLNRAVGSTSDHHHRTSASSTRQPRFGSRSASIQTCHDLAQISPGDEEQPLAPQLPFQASLATETCHTGPEKSLHSGVSAYPLLDNLSSRYVVIEGLLSTHHDARWILTLPGVVGYSTHLLDADYLILRFDTFQQAQASLIEVRTKAGQVGLAAQPISRPALEELQPALPPSFFSKSEGVISVSLTIQSGAPWSCCLDQLVPLMSTFGPIRRLSIQQPDLLECEYWAETSAAQAFKVLQGKEIGGALLGCHLGLEAIHKLVEGHAVGPAAQTQHNSPSVSNLVPLANSQHAACAARIQAWAEDVDRASSQDRTFVNQSQDVPVSIGSSSFATPKSSSRAPRPVSNQTLLEPEYGIYREDDKIPARNLISLSRIEQGLDMRLTLMLKNIPNKATDQDVMRYIEEVAGRCFDVIYIRQDWRTGLNVGYGFVNFISTDALLTFARARLGTRWNLAGSDKLCIASYANIQGKANLVAHFRNSSVLDQEESRRPKLFYSDGPLAGQPEPFPACNDPVRKARSVANAGHFGLFPSTRPVFRVAQALSTLNI